MKDFHRDLDLVLYAFMEACPTASDADVSAWQKRFPQFARDIADHAEATRHCIAAEAEPITAEAEAEAEAYGAAVAKKFVSDARFAETAPVPKVRAVHMVKETKPADPRPDRRPWKTFDR